MQLALRVPLRQAEQVKLSLNEQGYLDVSRRARREKGILLLPVTQRFRSEFEFVEAYLESVSKVPRLRELVPDAAKTSYDVVGSIAILESDGKNERQLAEGILKQQKGVKTIVAKVGGHEGELRLQHYRFLAGVDTRETIVKENGVQLKIDIEKVYYSVRSSTERKRVASLVKPSERVLVMFAGAAPYVCVIAKAAKEVVGIELNPEGYRLGVENIALNKLTNATMIEGDVKMIVPILAAQGNAFDRIVMPLPHTGVSFLEEAFMVAHKGTVIHFYTFQESAETAKAFAEKEAKRKIRILGATLCGQQAPKLYRVCVDMECRE